MKEMKIKIGGCYYFQDTDLVFEVVGEVSSHTSTIKEGCLFRVKVIQADKKYQLKEGDIDICFDCSLFREYENPKKQITLSL